MNPYGRIRTSIVLLGCAAALAAGCGGSSSPSSDTGSGGNGKLLAPKQARELFARTCGGCHSLKDAGTHGTFGPNLDELQPDRADVRNQVEHGGGGMPQGLLHGNDADSVAAYVAAVAGK